MKTECQVYRTPCDNSTPGGQEPYEQATPSGQDTLETSIPGPDATTRKKSTPDGQDEHEQSIEGGQEHLKHQPLVDSIKLNLHTRWTAKMRKANTRCTGRI